MRALNEMDLRAPVSLEKIDNGANAGRGENHEQEMHRVIDRGDRGNAGAFELARQGTTRGVEDAGIRTVAVPMKCGQRIRQPVSVEYPENCVCCHIASLPPSRQKAGVVCHSVTNMIGERVLSAKGGTNTTRAAGNFPRPSMRLVFSWIG